MASAGRGRLIDARTDAVLEAFIFFVSRFFTILSVLCMFTVMLRLSPRYIMSVNVADGPIEGRVFYLIPSVSLFQQSMWERATQRSIPHSYIGICSDTRAGRNDETESLQELDQSALNVLQRNQMSGRR